VYSRRRSLVGPAGLTMFARGGDTARPGGLHARPCHAFLVLFLSITIRTSRVSMGASTCTLLNASCFENKLHDLDLTLGLLAGAHRPANVWNLPFTLHASCLHLAYVLRLWLYYSGKGDRKRCENVGVPHFRQNIEVVSTKHEQRSLLFGSQ